MPFGANTVPLMLVVSPLGQVVRWVHRPVHADADAHTFAALHAAPAPHVPQSSMWPHPSAGVPQVNACDAQVLGTHVALQTPSFGELPPPHVSSTPHVPHSRAPVQPSDCVPHEYPSSAQV